MSNIPICMQRLLHFFNKKKTARSILDSKILFYLFSGSFFVGVGFWLLLISIHVSLKSLRLDNSIGLLACLLSLMAAFAFVAFGIKDYILFFCSADQINKKNSNKPIDPLMIKRCRQEPAQKVMASGGRKNETRSGNDNEE